ncbi:germin-like protein subfamily 3 member 2 [Macadamia integrifolia]|uniref:germin-like protein subfamily 3 member 2 n=1 Tax=Macadamia integrifolia TaxID=60698 RepID=UPI001C4EACE5|nr:germin-like protein subfamily 3 member 2 [Macadamia integrifolia]
MEGEMCPRTKIGVLVITFLFFLNRSHKIMASDPDPVLDFCIPYTPKPESVTIGPLSGLHWCKNASEATADDFIFSGIKSAGDFKESGFSALSINPTAFPGLNTLGMSFVRADLDVGGINVPHFHPRATEVALVLEGKVYSGFVDSANRIYAKVIEKGEVMVFPRGLVHFQMNVGDSPATIYGSFNSQNPGLQRIPAAVFGSGIKEELLKKAFGLSGEQIDEMRRKFRPKEERETHS